MAQAPTAASHTNLIAALRCFAGRRPSIASDGPGLSVDEMYELDVGLRLLAVKVPAQPTH